VDYNYHSAGSVPGTLTIPSDANPTELVLISYNADQFVRKIIQSPEECRPYLELDMVCWLDIRGLGTESVLRQVAQVFNLHPLILEDVVNVPQRPKLEIFEEQLLLVTHMLRPSEDGWGFTAEQVSMVLQHHILLTFQEESLWDCFDFIRDRLQRGMGNLRENGAGFLTYTLLDTIVDEYFPLLETYGEYVNALEDEVVEVPNRSTLQRIHDVRRELLMLRRYVWPLRTAVNNLIRDGGDIFTPDNRIFLQDCYDHIVQILDILETYREVSSSLMDVYLSSVSNRMNEVMKVLTVISSIFIPLTFIAGVYGMNFNPDSSPLNMPELNWYWGYPVCMAFMLAIGITLFVYFWKRGWLQDSTGLSPDNDA
jgi:magnesium transporter